MIKDRIRQSLVRIKRRAAPVDRRLKQLPAYHPVRKRLLEAYRSSSWAAQADRNVYIREYAETAVDDSLAMFDSFWGRKVTGNSFAIFLEMYRDPSLTNLRFVWVRNAGVAVPAWMERDKRIRFVQHGSIEYARALLSARYLVGNSNFKEYFIRKPDQIYVNPWHGIMLKKLGRDIDQPLRDSANTQRNFNQSSIIALPSRWVIDTTINAYGVLFGHDRAIESGSPRVDLTLNADVQAVRQHLGVPEGKKVLLYAPTWRGDIRNVSMDLTTQLRALKSISEEFGDSFEVFVSLHNYVASRLDSIPAGPRLVPDDITINEVLSAVDVLVSDYSSIFFDFLVLDRPVVLYAYDRAEYTSSRGLYMDLEDLPVAVAEDRDGLLNAIAAGKQPSSFECYDEAMKKYLPREDGAASRRVVEAMLDRNDDPPRCDDKVRVLVSAGTLDPGPTSEALISFLNSLDPEKYHAVVVFGASAVDRSVGRGLVVSRLPEWCEIVARRGAAVIPASIKSEYSKWLAGEATAEQAAQLEPWLQLESRRVFGGIGFDVAVNFSVDSVFWTRLLTDVGARRCIAAINVALTEVQRYSGSGSIDGVLGELGRYSHAAFFSDELLRRNRALLRSRCGELELVVVKPVVDRDQVERRASRDRDVPDELHVKLCAIRTARPEARPPIYVGLGDFTAERHFDRLLHAFSRVVAQRDDAILVLLGRGPLRSRLSALARRLEIAGSVIFASDVDNPLPTVKMADCVVVGSDVDLDWACIEQSRLLGARTVCTDLAAAANLPGTHPVVAADAEALGHAMLGVLSGDAPASADPTERPTDESSQPVGESPAASLSALLSTETDPA